MKRASLGAMLVIVALLLGRRSDAQLADSFTNWIAHPAIAYETRPASDPVALLNRRLQTGDTQLTFEERSGYLRSTLDALQIPVESQVALFNRDSLQNQLISSMNPRAIFFNDAVAVGYVRGGFIELAAHDPQQGIVFYALENGAADSRPRFTRRFDCLNCHYSYSTVGVPGMLDRSNGQLAVDHTLPLDQRWGGFYVTGDHELVGHMGNRVPLPPGAAAASSPTWASLNVKVDTTGYLSDRSDIVALLVFNHQMRAMNFIARIGWEARVAAFERNQSGGQMFKLPKGVAADAPVPLQDAARELVDYFLFVNEAPLSAPVRGSAGFAEKFASVGPRDTQGRSLRQLDLQTRLLRYPCSYLIYADAFTALPAEAREAIYQRLWRVLSGQELDARYRHLSRADRQAIIEILRQTKTDLPAYFQ